MPGISFDIGDTTELLPLIRSLAVDEVSNSLTSK